MQYKVFSSQAVSQKGVGEEPKQLSSHRWQLRHEIRNNW